jgi:hypothetical protein
MRAKNVIAARTGRLNPASVCAPLLLGCLLLLTAGTGCRLLKTAVDVPTQTVRATTPGKKGQSSVDAVELQQTLLRFADEYLTRMASDANRLRRGTNAPNAAEILRCKIELGTATCSIASGPNPIANLLDMTVFVTVTRMSVEEYWQPMIFGESAQAMLESSRSAEADMWKLAATVLNAEQQAELHRAIEEWRRKNTQPESIVSARAVGFASQVTAGGRGGVDAAGSLKNLLMLDPLTGLDPAVHEVAQTRLFAERALFVAQKIPTLLRWHTELLGMNTADIPAVRQLVTNSTQLTAALERFAVVAENLPEQVSAEREEVLKALQSQEKELMPLVSEVHQSLATGTQMSTSLNTTLTTFDGLMKRFGVGEPKAPGPQKTNAVPFRIQDYTASAVQLEATARQLTELLTTLDQTLGSTNLLQLSAQFAPLAKEARNGGREVVDYAFGRGLLLIAVALAGALAYCFIKVRIVGRGEAAAHGRGSIGIQNPDK